jgi:hypothetical protein
MKAAEAAEAEDMTAMIGMIAGTGITAIINMTTIITIKKKVCLKTITAHYQTIGDRVTNYDSK